MQVLLTEDQKAFVRQAIKTGRYNREEDALQDALSLWEDRERTRAEMLTEVAVAERPVADDRAMDRDHVIATLRAHEEELKSAGILGLALFGSRARNEATAQSDVDLMADFDPNARLSLFGLSRLRDRLSDILGAQVDLVQQRTLKPRVKERAQRDSVRAF